VTKLTVRITEYPEQVTRTDDYTIQAVKGPHETRFGPALINIVTNTKGEQRSLFVPYSTEVSPRTNLARLMQTLGDDTDRWVGHKVHITVDKDGKRTIEPVVEQ
jgi:hypothetical protein